MKKLLSFAFILCGMSSMAQVFTPVNPTTYGRKENRVKIDSALHIPQKVDTLRNSGDTTAQIFFNKLDSSIWYWSRATNFRKIASGSQIDTTGQFVTTIQSLNDTVLQFKLGGILYNVPVKGRPGSSTPSLQQVVTVGNTSSIDLLINGLTIGRGPGNIATATAIGTNALRLHTSGTYPVAVGQGAAEEHVSGQGITAVGGFTMNDNTTGTFNSIFGYANMTRDRGGHYNVMIGADIATQYTWTTADTLYMNTLVGYQAGRNKRTGKFNAWLGGFAGYNSVSTDSTVYLGGSAGYNETQSGVLHIANRAEKSLITGKFGTNQVVINNSPVATFLANTAFEVRSPDSTQGSIFAPIISNPRMLALTNLPAGSHIINRDSSYRLFRWTGSAWLGYGNSAGGSSSTRFGLAGEDDATSVNRIFTGTGASRTFSVTMTDGTESTNHQLTPTSYLLRQQTGSGEYAEYSITSKEHQFNYWAGSGLSVTAKVPRRTGYLVMSVNNTQPDAQGNVTVAGGGTTYTGQTPIVVTGTVISADTSKFPGQLATYSDLQNKWWNLTGNASTNPINQNFTGSTDTTHILKAHNKKYSAGTKFAKYIYADTTLISLKDEGPSLRYDILESNGTTISAGGVASYLQNYGDFMNWTDSLDASDALGGSTAGGFRRPEWGTTQLSIERRTALKGRDSTWIYIGTGVSQAAHVFRMRTAGQRLGAKVRIVDSYTGIIHSFVMNKATGDTITFNFTVDANAGSKNLRFLVHLEPLAKLWVNTDKGDSTLTVDGGVNFKQLLNSTDATDSMVVAKVGGGLGKRPVAIYKEYTAKLTQTGTNAPVATEVFNDLGTLTWSRSSSGTYTVSSSNLFTVNKTVVFLTPNNTGCVVYHAGSFTVGGIAIGNALCSTGAGIDNWDATITIRVYN